jgi:hypothetical protein
MLGNPLLNLIKILSRFSINLDPHTIAIFQIHLPLTSQAFWDGTKGGEILCRLISPSQCLIFWERLDIEILISFQIILI